MIKVRGLFVHYHERQASFKHSSNIISEHKKNLSSSGKGKIRYLAGRSIAVTKKSTLTSIKNSINSNKPSITLIQAGQSEIYHLNHLRTNYLEVANGEHDGTLDEIERKQNGAGGLTHVRNEVFSFFLELETRRNEVHNMQAVSLHRDKIFHYATHELINDLTLVSRFKSLFNEMPNQDDRLIENLYTKLVKRYLVVANNEYRKHLLDQLGKVKKHAHRMEIYKRKKQTKDLKGDEEQMKERGKQGNQNAIQTQDEDERKTKTKGKANKKQKNNEEYVAMTEKKQSGPKNENVGSKAEKIAQQTTNRGKQGTSKQKANQTQKEEKKQKNGQPKKPESKNKDEYIALKGEKQTEQVNENGGSKDEHTDEQHSGKRKRKLTAKGKEYTLSIKNKLGKK